MATARKPVKAGIQVVDFAVVHWFHAENSRQESFGNPLADLGFNPEKPDEFKEEPMPNGDAPNGLVRSLFGGWVESQGVVSVLTVEHYAEMFDRTVEDVLAAIEKERRDMIDAWDAQEATKGVAATARAVWFDTDNVMRPVWYVGNECFRRSYALMGVVHKRGTIAGSKGSREYELPVSVKQFANDLQRILAHASENTMKDVGRSAYKPLDYLKLAVQVQRANGGEKELLSIGVKKGTAQKVLRVAQLSNKYPKVRLVERCFMPVPDEGAILEYTPDCYVPLAKLDKEEVQRLLLGFGPHDKQRTDAIRVTDEVVHKWLAEVVVGKVQKTKSMSGVELGRVKTAHPSRLVQDFIEAINANNARFFEELATIYEELDAPYVELLKSLGRVDEDGNDIVPDSESTSDEVGEEVSAEVGAEE